MYHNYLFDLYGTLVDIHTNEDNIEVWEKLSLFYGYYGASYTPQELKDAYAMEVGKAQKQQEIMEGTKQDQLLKSKKADVHEANPEIQLEYVFQNLFKQKGITVDLTQSTYAGQIFRLASTEYIRLYEGVKPLLQSLKQRGHKVYLLSNAQSIFTRYEMRYLGIEDLFDDIFISSEYGCKKPDSRFYKVPLEKYDLKPEETIMIGNDYVCDILGAQQLGLHTFYIHSNLSPDLSEAVQSTYHLMEMDLKKVETLLKEVTA